MLIAVVVLFAAALPLTLLLAAVDREGAPLADLDARGTADINGFVLDHRWLIRPMQATSYIFHAWVFRGIVLALVAWLLVRGARRLAAWAVVTITAGGLLGLLTKILVDRPRPDLPTPIAHFPGGSFPSGHAMTAVVGSATTVLILLALIHGIWRWLAWTIAALISFASGVCRVALGVHYISDVVAGWLLGAAVVAATTIAFEAWRRSEGRTPVHPAQEGVEPEAAPQISPLGDAAEAPPRT
ncbi:phosphatase PAP2 family protein [Actinocorallia longicatena]